MQLPVDAKLTVFRDILSFFEYIASQNYVAIDFYDESIMYDFENGKTTICDIDFFRKQPCSNDMGRMWGSSRFQAPEEFQLGCHALDLIEERIKVRLPEDEAASIAFHLVNSEFGGMRLRDTQIMTEIIRHLIGMIRADYHFPEDLVYEDRLITNLKFMLNRLIQNKEGWITEDARFNEFVRANYRNEYELARAMRDYIESVVSCKMTEEEVIYLAVQLKYADIKKKEGKKNGIF